MVLSRRVRRIATAVLALLILAGIVPAASAAADGSISGSVFGPTGPAADMCVNAESPDDFASTQTDAAGQYLLEGLTPGAYRVWFSECGPSGRDLIGGYHPDGAEYADATQFVVTEGVTTPAGASTLAEGGAILGTVRDAGGDPVQGVCGRAHPADTEWDTAGSSFASGLDGRYGIRGVPAGAWKVEYFDCSGGSGRIRDEWHQDATSFAAADVVHVAVGQEAVADETVEVREPSISGVVTGPSGPVPTCVTPYRADDQWSAVPGAGTFAHDGQYTIYGLDPGRYKVRFEDCGATPSLAPEWYDDAPTFSGADVVEVGAGSPTEGVDAVLAVGGSITGTVTGSGGPLGGVDVDVYLVDGEDVRRHETRATTAADGRYDAGGLSAGTHVVYFSDPDGGHSSEYYDDVVLADDATEVPVSAGQTVTGIDADLAAGSAIAGTVTDSTGQPAVGVCVSASGDDGFESDSTDSLGGYELRGLRPGTYTVRFSCVPEGQSVEWYDDQHASAAADPVVVEVGADRTGIDAQLEPAGTIAGRVVDTAGDPVVGLCVEADPTSFDLPWADAVTAADGSYVIYTAGADTYRIRFTTCETTVGTWVAEYWDDQTLWSNADLVAVDGAVAVTGIDAVLQASGALSGTLTRQDGSPAAGDCVSLYDSATGAYAAGSGASGADGSYVVDSVLPGSYHVFAADCTDPYLGHALWYPSGSSRNEAVALDVFAGNTTPAVDMVVPADGRVIGTVTDETGMPAADVCVGLLDAEEQILQFDYTDQDGRYEIRAEPGEYVVGFRSCLDERYEDRAWQHADTFEAATPVQVTPDDTVVADETMRFRAGIVGKVTDDVTGNPLAGICVSAWDGDSYGNAETDEVGQYRITGVPAGEYVVQFYDCSSPREHFSEWHADAATWETSTPVAFDGATTAVVDSALRRGAVISGTVSDETGPVTDICVQAVDAVEYSFGGYARSFDGAYEIGPLEPGGYRLHLEECGDGGHLSAWHDDATLAEDADVVTAAVGAPLVVDLGVRTGATIAGQVTDGEGQPLGGVCVGVVGEVVSDRTAADGTYELRGLRTGSYKVRFQDCDGLEPRYLDRYFDDVVTAADATLVDATEGARTEDVDGVLRVEGAISGTVAGSDGLPLVGMCVSTIGSGAVTDAEGRFVLNELESGTYAVTVTDCGAGEHLTTVVEGLQVELAVVTEMATLEVGTRPAVSGTATNATAGPKAGVCVAMFAGDVLVGNTVTASDGTWSIRPDHVGDVKVRFRDCVEELVADQWFDGATSYETAATLTLTPASTHLGIDAAMGATGSIGGTVTEGELPFAGACVAAVGPDGKVVNEASTSDDGTYRLVVPAADDYTVAFFDGCGAQRRLLEWWDASPTYEGAAPIDLAAGADLAGIDASIPANIPPVASLQVSPDCGSSPLTSSVTFGATDADGNRLMYHLSVDGVTVSTGVLPGPAVEHEFAQAGFHTVALRVDDGRASVGAVTTVEVGGGPLAVTAGSDRVAFEDEPLTFDATGADAPGCPIQLEWDFGDGSTATGSDPSHSYAEPGRYDVSLTATRGPESVTDTLRVDVVGEGTPGLLVTVTDTDGTPLADSSVVAVDPTGRSRHGTTDQLGRTLLPDVADGTMSVSAVRLPGHRPARVDAEVVGGVGEATIALARGGVVGAELTHRQLTLDEIIALGIDPNDPDNQNIERRNIVVRRPGGAVLGGGGGGGGGGGFCAVYRGDELFEPQTVPEGWGCSLPENGSWTFDGYRITPVASGDSMILLVVPIEARSLKEFFEVELIVTNFADAGFDLTDGTAHLDVPPGLSLAPTASPQAASQIVPTVPGGGAQSAVWVLRGDEEGLYDLTAGFSGVLQPFGAPVHVAATTQEPLRVWGSSALQTVVELEPEMSERDPYRMRVGLRNVSDAPVYNVGLSLLDEGRINFIYQPRQRTEYQQGTLLPGATLWTDEMVLVPTESGEVGIEDSYVATVAGAQVLDSTFTELPLPDAVPDLRVAAPADRRDGAVDLQWEPVEGAIGYEVFVTSDPLTPFGPEPVASIGAGTTSAQVDLGVGVGGELAVSTLFADGFAMRHPLTAGRGSGMPPQWVTPTKPHTYLNTIDRVDDTVVFKASDGPGGSVTIELLEVPAGASCAPQQGTNPAEVRCSVASVTTPGPLVARAVDANGLSAGEREVVVGPIRYVALGDSFSSGEGVPTTDAGVPVTPTLFGDDGSWFLGVDAADDDGGYGCHRSRLAYSQLLAGRVGLPRPHSSGEDGVPRDEADFQACSGAVIGDVVHEQLVGPPDPGVALVTMTVGGNDMQFIWLLLGCLLSPNCVPAGEVATSVIMHGLGDRLAALYRDVAAQYPNAEILIGGYPRFLSTQFAVRDCLPAMAGSDPHSGGWQAAVSRETGRTFGHFTGLGLSYVERLWMVEQIKNLNDVIHDSIHTVNRELDATGRLSYADVEEAFIGDELCSDGDQFKFMNGLEPRAYTHSVHPNAAGQAKYADAFDRAITAFDLSNAFERMSIRPLETHVIDVNVAAGTPTGTFSTSWPGSDVVMTLVSPSGRRITRSTDAPDVNHDVSPTSELYVLADPEPGLWRVELFGADVDPGGEPVAFAFQAIDDDNQPPVAAMADHVDAGNAPAAVAFDGSESTDDSGIETWVWDFGDGTVAQGPKVSHSYVSRGVYTPTLTVIDAEGETDTVVGDPITVDGSGVVTGAIDGPAGTVTPGSRSSYTATVRPGLSSTDAVRTMEVRVDLTGLDETSLRWEASRLGAEAFGIVDLSAMSWSDTLPHGSGEVHVEARREGEEAVWTFTTTLADGTAPEEGGWLRPGTDETLVLGFSAIADASPGSTTQTSGTAIANDGQVADLSPWDTTIGSVDGGTGGGGTGGGGTGGGGTGGGGTGGGGDGGGTPGPEVPTCDPTMPHGFSDVPDSNVHAEAISCLVQLAIAEGRGDGTFDPAGEVRRGQLASFVARWLEAAGHPLPDSPPDAFTDDDGSVHERRINQMAAIGVIMGNGSRFVPADVVTRAQTASVIVRALELLVDAALPDGVDAFDDDTGSVHERAIDKVAAVGVVEGIGSRRFHPSGALHRDQMASVLHRANKDADS